MKTTDAFGKIDVLNDEYVKVWVDVCNIESQTKVKSGVDKVGEYFIDIAKKYGWTVDVCKQENAGDAICVTMNPECEEKLVCLSAHMDTVHPEGLFGYPPTRIEDGKIYGPGVTDCKGGAVAAFLAMAALSECGYKDSCVKMVLQSDEEVGSSLSNKQTVDFMCEHAKGAKAFINLEGSTAGEACIQRKGIATFNFVIKGEEAHSAKCATEGANAIAEAAEKIIRLEKFKDAEGLTCCCSLISGGTVSNTVPGHCKFSANVRFATVEQYKKMCEYTDELAKTSFVKGCTTTVSHKYRPPMELKERNIQLLERMNEIFEKNGFSTLKGSKRVGGSDAAYVTEAGIPCVDSVGVTGDKIHSKDEFAYVDSLSDSAKRMAAVIIDI